MEQLEKSWQELIDELGAEETASAILFAEISRLYSQPGRYYHTLRHISAMLTAINELSPAQQDRFAIELAVYFHDVIYDSQANDNEEQSAEFARRHLVALGLPAPLIEEVARLVLLTKTHRTEQDDSAGQILLDADLSILGAAPNKYQEYAQAVRHEYEWVPEERYRAERRRILQNFLARPQLYLTHRAQTLWEETARHNLEQEVLLEEYPFGASFEV